MSCYTIDAIDCQIPCVNHGRKIPSGGCGETTFPLFDGSGKRWVTAHQGALHVLEADVIANLVQPTSSGVLAGKPKEALSSGSQPVRAIWGIPKSGAGFVADCGSGFFIKSNKCNNQSFPGTVINVVSVGEYGVAILLANGKVVLYISESGTIQELQFPGQASSVAHFGTETHTLLVSAGEQVLAFDHTGRALGSCALPVFDLNPTAGQWAVQDMVALDAETLAAFIVQGSTIEGGLPDSWVAIYSVKMQPGAVAMNLQGFGTNDVFISKVTFPSRAFLRWIPEAQILLASHSCADSVALYHRAANKNFQCYVMPEGKQLGCALDAATAQNTCVRGIFLAPGSGDGVITLGLAQSDGFLAIHCLEYPADWKVAGTMPLLSASVGSFGGAAGLSVSQSLQSSGGFFAAFSQQQNAPSSGSAFRGFGATAALGAAAAPAGSAFGGFGAAAPSGAAAPAASAFGGFGSASPTKAAAPAASPYGGFGSLTNSLTSSGTNLFAAAATATAGASPFGAFGGTPASATASSAATSSGFGAFGAAAALSPATGVFGAASAASSSAAPSGFGGFSLAAPAASSAAPSGFGAFAATAASSSAASGGFGGFGAAASSSAQGFGAAVASSSAGGLFAAAAASSSSTGSVFGGFGKALAAGSSSSSLFTLTPNTSGSAFGQPASTGGSLFGQPVGSASLLPRASATGSAATTQTSSGSATSLFGAASTAAAATAAAAPAAAAKAKTAAPAGGMAGAPPDPFKMAKTLPIPAGFGFASEAKTTPAAPMPPMPKAGIPVPFKTAAGVPPVGLGAVAVETAALVPAATPRVPSVGELLEGWKAGNHAKPVAGDKELLNIFEALEKELCYLEKLNYTCTVSKPAAFEGDELEKAMAVLKIDGGDLARLEDECDEMNVTVKPLFFGDETIVETDSIVLDLRAKVNKVGGKITQCLEKAKTLPFAGKEDWHSESPAFVKLGLANEVPQIMPAPKLAEPVLDGSRAAATLFGSSPLAQASPSAVSLKDLVSKPVEQPTRPAAETSIETPWQILRRIETDAKKISCIEKIAKQVAIAVADKNDARKY